ncbi:FAD-dependent oxidoreductase [Candidatus Saccharibacteria bacterium]|nr:FAD-dependent oxidoreductase [Candidatus Saccharibacteria bacterium]
MNKHTHVIVGGGFGGLRIARLLMNRDDIEVIVINPQSSFEYHGSLYRSANGYSPLETAIPYREIFKDGNIEYRQDFMTDIDPVRKRILLLSGHELSYDSATLALGYEPEYFGIPGMRDFSNTLYSLADALTLRKSMASIAQKSRNSLLPAKIIVVGGGPTGVETAASIPHFFELATGIDKVQVLLLEAQARILGGMSNEFSKLVSSSLPSQVEIRCDQKVIRATNGLLHIAGASSIPFDSLIWTAGSSANSYFRQRPDLFEVDRSGRVAVDEFLASRHDGLYIVGDSAAVIHTGTAHAAIEMGTYVATRIITTIYNTTQEKYSPTQPTYAVPNGHDSAVAMQGETILTGDDGWRERRRLDLQALLLIAPEDVAHYHWAKGDTLARMFDNGQL